MIEQDDRDKPKHVWDDPRLHNESRSEFYQGGTMSEAPSWKDTLIAANQAPVASAGEPVGSVEVGQMEIKLDSPAQVVIEGSTVVEQIEINADAPPPEITGYTFLLGDRNFKIVFCAPANKFQYFLQKLVGIKWLRVVK